MSEWPEELNSERSVTSAANGLNQEKPTFTVLTVNGSVTVIPAIKPAEERAEMSDKENTTLLFDVANNYARLRSMVQQGMKWDDNKTDLWFITKNPNLGGIAPFKLILMGRVEKLAKWIESRLDENTPHPGGDES